ncbi:MAG: coproporphyrinogen III oxidase [Betaproteobacteria bacterium]
MTSPLALLEALPPLHALMCRFETDTPACSVYPSPNRFVEAIGADDVAQAMRLRGLGRSVGGAAPLAVQVSLPLCERPCTPCTCRQVVTRRHASAARYLRGLQQELAAAADALGPRQVAARIHVGGATPLFMSDEQLGQLVASLRAAFSVADDADLSIEAAESLCTPERAAHLRATGFDRLTLMLDDSADDHGDGALHDNRLAHVVAGARAAGFSGVAVVLACGSPRLGAAQQARVVRRVTAARPDRIRIVRHAGAPGGPRAFLAAGAADPAAAIDRSARLLSAIEALQSAGYVHLGLDEFALPADPLCRAHRQGRLHLGPCGFSARPVGDVLALGAGAVGRIGSVAYQNVAELSRFYDALAAGALPVARGLALSRDDLARRGVILGLLCQGRVDFESISLAHLIDMRDAFAREFALLGPLVQAGLVDVDDEAMELTATGRWFAPVVAAVFDRELQRDVLRGRLGRGE